MVDALTLKGDEGRGVAAICFGEVLSNLRSGDLRMGQPYRVTLDNVQVKRLHEQTSGSKTFQYREEKRPIGIPLVAASETGEAQTQPQNRITYSRESILGMGVQTTVPRHRRG